MILMVVSNGSLRRCDSNVGMDCQYLELSHLDRSIIRYRTSVSVCIVLVVCRRRQVVCIDSAARQGGVSSVEAFINFMTDSSFLYFIGSLCLFMTVSAFIGGKR